MAKLNGKVIDLSRAHTADSLAHKKALKSITNLSASDVSASCREAAAKDPIKPAVREIKSRADYRLSHTKCNPVLSGKHADRDVIPANEIDSRKGEHRMKGKEKRKGVSQLPRAYSPVSQGADCVYGNNQISRVTTSVGKFRNGKIK